MGISTGWGGGSRLIKIIGKRKALQLLASAKTVNYSKAIDFGLVDGSMDTTKVILWLGIIGIQGNTEVQAEPSQTGGFMFSLLCPEALLQWDKNIIILKC